jgi:hypothetical protein
MKPVDEYFAIIIGEIIPRRPDSLIHLGTAPVLLCLLPTSVAVVRNLVKSPRMIGTRWMTRKGQAFGSEVQ